MEENTDGKTGRGEFSTWVGFLGRGIWDRERNVCIHTFFFLSSLFIIEMGRGCYTSTLFSLTIGSKRRRRKSGKGVIGNTQTHAAQCTMLSLVSFRFSVFLFFSLISFLFHFIRRVGG